MGYDDFGDDFDYDDMMGGMFEPGSLEFGEGFCFWVVTSGVEILLAFT